VRGRFVLHVRATPRTSRAERTGKAWRDSGSIDVCLAVGAPGRPPTAAVALSAAQARKLADVLARHAEEAEAVRQMREREAGS